MAEWEVGWDNPPASGPDAGPKADEPWGIEPPPEYGTWNTQPTEKSVTETSDAEKLKFNVEDFDVNPQDAGWATKELIDYATAQASFKELDTRADVPKWSSEARKYEWKDEYGELAPEDPELEEELFEKSHRPQKGDRFNVISEIKVNIEGPSEIHRITRLEDAGFHPQVMANLKRSKYDVTTPIQAFTIPAALTGSDVIGIAQTGSGKTVAYLAPVVSKLMGKADKLCKAKPNPETYDQKTTGITAEPLVLILVPTRELAQQVYYEARRLCYRSKLRPCTVYGGGPRSVQINDLMRGCDVLVGTPGRLADIVTTAPGALSLKRLKHTIFDEADELMGADWEPQMAPMLTSASAYHNEDRQFMMFSATFERGAREAAEKYLDPEHFKISVGRLGSSHTNIHQVIVWADDDLKRQCLVDLLMALPVARTIIFCASIPRAIEIDDFLYRLKFPTNPLHSSLTQREREEAMEKFRRGSSPVLVTTHLGGRGLDVDNVQHVVNFDLPSLQHGGINVYTHQIGRTGRIGNVGQATSFFNTRNEDIAPDLAKFLLECDHQLPEFLMSFAPPDGIVKWEDDLGDQIEENAPLEQAAPTDPADPW